MDLHIALQDRHDLSGQIYRQLRSGILAGRLAAGMRLPSTRDLARQLGVSRKTTLEAFERLLSEGYIRTQAGSGSFVSEGLLRPAANASGTHAIQQGPATVWDTLPPALAMPASATSSYACDFRGGVTDKTRFPFDVWRRCLLHGLRLQARGSGAYQDPAGVEALRIAIAHYLGYHRAVACDPDSLILTQGAQQALDLLARTAVRPGDVVAIEDPGYPPARASFLAAGARVICVPVDAQGLQVDQLPPTARLVYTTPSHQFPLGMPMSLARRTALLSWAQARGAVVIEDDYDGEFRFEGRPLDALKSLDRAGRVAYVGTFSKTLLPELRVGYLIAPPHLHASLLKAKQVSDWHGCTLTQHALAKLLNDGAFAKHLRRMHKCYVQRREILLHHLQGPLAAWLTPIVPAAGIHLSAILHTPLTENQLVAGAADPALGLYGIAAFYAQVPVRQGLLFGYGGVEVEAIDNAMRRLADIMNRRGSREK